MQDLMKEYDTLVTKLDDLATSTTTISTSNNNTNTEQVIGDQCSSDDSTIQLSTAVMSYSNLYLVCCIILNIDTNSINGHVLSDIQRETITTAARRSYILQRRAAQILQDDADDVDEDKFDTLNDFTFFPAFEHTVIVRQVTSLGNNNELFFWRNNKMNINDNETNLETVKQEIKMTFDKNELSEEEDILYKMANTPIPDNFNDEKTQATKCNHPQSFMYDLINRLILEEWGHDKYNKLLSHTKDDSIRNKIVGA
jgi:hypothetical protein